MENENKIILSGLKRVIPYKWRIQSYGKHYPSAACIAYIDARDVMDLLDEIAGPENWQSDYKEIKGNLYCGVAIRINGEWIWKWDCGTEPKTEKEKGEASDAFKRAAVKWGIGRFLYDMPVQWVKTDGLKTDKNYPNPVDDRGEKIKDITRFLNENSKIPEVVYSEKKAVKPAIVKNATEIKINIDEEAEIEIGNCNSLDDLTNVYNGFIDKVRDKDGFTKKCTKRKTELPAAVKK